MIAYIGIDPGAKGCMCVIEKERIILTPFDKYTYHDVFYHDLIPCEVSGISEYKCMIENVHSMPGQGVASTFKLGYNAGIVYGAMVALGIPVGLVSPVTWQKEFGLTKIKGETQTQRKRRHLIKAQELFPDLKMQVGDADSVLIAEYCRRKHG